MVLTATARRDSILRWARRIQVSEQALCPLQHFWIWQAATTARAEEIARVVESMGAISPELIASMDDVLVDL